MSLNIIKSKVKVTLNDCIELISHLPGYKIGFKAVMLFFPIYCVITYFRNLDDFSAVAQNATDLNRLKVEAIVIAGVAVLIFELFAFAIYKITPKLAGRTLYNKLKRRGMEELEITFDKENKKFIFGSKNKEIIPTSSLQIVSTERNYLFYFSKGLFSKRLFLPKDKNDPQGGIGEEIIKILKEDHKTLKIRKK